MYRIGIIGSENSHAMAFSKLFNGLTEGVSFPDMRVVAVMGEDEKATREVFDTCGVEFIPDSPRDMLGRVDAVMVTSRDGALHARYARPFLEAGLPVFIDKPFTRDPAEALELAKLALSHGAPIMGGSSTKLVADTLALAAAHTDAVAAGKALGGSVWAPVSMVNPYGGFYFYASHLVEIALTVFGGRPQTACAVEAGGHVAALLAYDAYAVSCHYADGAYHYGGAVLTKDGPVSRSIDIADCYRLETEQFAAMVRTGKSHCARELIMPIYVLDALDAAYRTGVAQRIREPNL